MVAPQIQRFKGEPSAFQHSLLVTTVIFEILELVLVVVIGDRCVSGGLRRSSPRSGKGRA